MTELPSVCDGVQEERKREQKLFLELEIRCSIQ